VVVCG